MSGAGNFGRAYSLPAPELRRSLLRLACRGTNMAVTGISIFPRREDVAFVDPSGEMPPKVKASWRTLA